MKIFSREETTPVDIQIAAVLSEMEDIGVESDGYSTMMEYLERLYKLKKHDAPRRVSRDTLAVVGGNLLGILMIVVYERQHVMMSKALSQIRTPRLG